jgi:hypothetical protein
MSGVRQCKHIMTCNCAHKMTMMKRSRSLCCDLWLRLRLPRNHADKEIGNVQIRQVSRKLLECSHEMQPWRALREHLDSRRAFARDDLSKCLMWNYLRYDWLKGFIYCPIGQQGWLTHICPTARYKHFRCSSMRTVEAQVSLREVNKTQDLKLFSSLFTTLYHFGTPHWRTVLTAIAPRG